MTTGQPSEALQGHLNQLFGSGTLTGMSDAELLDQFVKRGPGSEFAFEAIVKRHGGMVFNVCQRLLGNPSAAEDAFQTTFFLLAQRSSRLHVRGTLAPWLHEVARRTSMKSRTTARRRQIREQKAVANLSVQTIDRDPTNDLETILHQEIDRLSLNDRVVVIHCYLQGRTHEETATVLGWPVGTVRGRLARAREELRTKLVRRGIAPAVAVGSFTATPTPVSARLIETVVSQAIGWLSANPAAAGLIPFSLVSMTMTHVFRVLSLSAILIGCASGAYLFSRQATPSPEQLAEADIPPTALKVQREGPGPRDRQGDPLSRAALTRIGSMRLRHGRNFGSIEFSPDSRWIVSKGRGTIRIWETSSGREIHHFPDQGPFGLSPDSTMWATVEQEKSSTDRKFSVVLRNLKTGEEIARAESPQFSSIYFSPDGNVLAGRYQSDTVCLYSVPSLKKLHLIESPYKPKQSSSPPIAVAFSPNGKTLITAADSVWLWDVATGKELKRIPLDSNLGTATSAMVLSDGKTLILSCWYSPRLWFDLETGKEIRRGKFSAVSSQGTMAAVVIPPKRAFPELPDPVNESSMDSFSISIVGLATGGEIRHLSGHPRVNCGWSNWGQENLHNWSIDSIGVQFSPDGKTLFSHSDQDDRIYLWDIATGKERFPDPASTNFVDPIQFTSDSKMVVTGDRDGYLRFWDARTGVEQYSIKAHLSSVSELVISVDGRTLISRGQDGPAKFWDVASGQEFRRLVLPAEGGLGSFVLSDNGRMLLMGCPNRHLIDLATVQVRGKLPRGDTSEMNPKRCRFTPGSRSVVSAYSTHLLEIDVSTGETLRRIDLKSSSGQKIISANLAIFPDGQRMAVADRNVYLLDWATGQEIARLPAPGAHHIQGLAISPDGRFLVAGDTSLAEDSDGPTLWVWEIASRRLLRRLASTHRGSITSLAFSPDGSLLASTSFEDSTSVIWDVNQLVKEPAQ